MSDGNYVADTANTAVFKLLLTGVDDTALTSSRKSTPEHQSQQAQIALLDQLIANYQSRVKRLAGPPAELENSLGRLEETMSKQAHHLAQTEQQYREASDKKRALLKRVEEGSTRLTEISALLDRFAKLDEHYASDISRLRAIEEAGTLFEAMSSSTCPLCGALPEHHRADAECDADMPTIVSAARAEIEKIELRKTELVETVTALHREAKKFERSLPKLRMELEQATSEVENIVAPNLRQIRASFRELSEKRGDVREALGLYGTLQDFLERKAALVGRNSDSADTNSTDVDLSTSTADKFARVVFGLLQDWHFPDVDRVHFDLKARDLVINGKSRISYGKGLRAITQSAFTIGLLEYCKQNDTNHPGFVVLDSPLLSYREPESSSDDLRDSDLNARFYSFLEKMDASRQVIVIENTDPPSDIQTNLGAIKFTGKLGDQKFGLFPPESNTDDQILS